jgi:hypothetical protein
MEGAFVTAFLPQYIRNNKSAIQKNLRCFPHCGASKHVTYGYCGAPVVLRVSFGRAPICENYVAFGDIVRHGTELSQPSISLAEMQKQSIDAGRPGNDLRLGVATNKVVKDESYESITFAFNTTRQPWHYGWSRYIKTAVAVLFLL